MREELDIPVVKRQPIFIPDVISKDEMIANRNRPFRKYREEVWKLTDEVAHLIPGIENRGWTKDHIDHIISIWYGFKKGMPVEMIASLNNLRMLHYRDNMRKGTRVLATEPINTVDYGQ